MSLSESASSQVQAILQAAENSAAAIKAEAEAEAERIRSAARESKQADVSGVQALVAKLRKDLDELEAQLKKIAAGDAPAEEQPPPEPETAKTTRAPKTPVAKDAADPDADAEGARLIALNMALNGESREAADKYLAENFDLGDRGALLDEVYASVEG
jgi:hypothetical protein